MENSWRPGRILALVAAALAATALAGCTDRTPMRTPPPEAAQRVAVVPGAPRARIWGDDAPPDLVARAQSAFQGYITRKWDEAGRPAAGVSFEVLALSGGGPDGAYGAGLLAGWSEAGTRPDFDIVTGISVGALIAPFAFLGEDYDPALRAIFTEFGREQVAEFAPFAALSGALGLADTAPLRRTIAELVDETVIARIAEEDTKGRALLIGTTNLDAGRPVVWNMGAIAQAGQIDLFRDVMLASASIPGAFPPVAITVTTPDGGERYREFHVDGGVTHSVILWPPGYGAALAAPKPFPVRETVYVIQNNSLAPRYEPVESFLPSIAARALSTLIRGQSAGDLLLIYQAAAAIGADFKLSFVPAGFGAAATDFDTAYMRTLFEAARADARDGIAWLDRPPVLLGRDALETALRGTPARDG